MVEEFDEETVERSRRKLELYIPKYLPRIGGAYTILPACSGFNQGLE
jgi:hypothetical protein